MDQRCLHPRVHPLARPRLGELGRDPRRRRCPRRRPLRRADRGPLRRRVDVPHSDRRLEGGAHGPRRLAGGERCHPARRAVGDTAPRLARRGGDPPRQLPAPAGGGDAMTERDEPWLMRTYSGHSTAAASNALYRTNLAKGQTGLSIAFDLPTQTGYDPDSPMARGEVGKVGVPIAHLGNMRTLLNGIAPAEMNTSMTINATAPWLLALYVANAEEQGTPATELPGTTQNDI